MQMRRGTIDSKNDFDDGDEPDAIMNKQKE